MRRPGRLGHGRISRHPSFGARMSLGADLQRATPLNAAMSVEIATVPGYRLIERVEQLPDLSAHYHACRTAGKPGVVLVGEGKL